MSGFNAHKDRKAWCGGDQDGTPDGAKLHSIIVDPRDPSHMYLSMSGGGTFESQDAGADWHPLNEGVRADFFPDPYPVFGQDPHCVRMASGNPDRLYMQNHCGIYRLDRPHTRWSRIGDHMPKSVGDIGLPLAVHPHDPDTAWVFPMDGTDVWPRTSPGGKPAAYRTRDGGKTWKRQAEGMPKSQGWWTVKRQAMTADAFTTAGVYFGTTSGEVWGRATRAARGAASRSTFPRSTRWRRRRRTTAPSVRPRAIADAGTQARSASSRALSCARCRSSRARIPP